MDVYLIRHAEPDYSKDSLTPHGFDQARQLAEHLRDVPFTDVYCSPMGRAQDTMGPTLADRDVEPVILPWLRELDGQIRPDAWVWNFGPARFGHTEGLAEEVEDFMADQKRMLVREWEQLVASHGYRRNGPVYLPDGDGNGEARPILAVFAHAGLILTLLSGIFEMPLAWIYSTVWYHPSAITHLQMLRQAAGFAELRILTLAARPHLDNAEQLGL